MTQIFAGLDRWLAGLARWQRWLIQLMLGALIAAGQSPLSLPLISLVALYFILRSFQQTQGAKAAAWFGWRVGTGYFAASIFWIVEPFMVDAARDGWMAPFALLLISTGLALFWMAGFLGAVLIAPGPKGRLLALVITLGLAELARAYVLTGFPWGLLAYIWVETPMIQLVAYIGPHGLGALTLMIVALPLVTRRPSWGVWAASLVVLVGFGVGMIRRNMPQIPPQNPVALRLIQPNAEQDKKWDPRYSPVYFRRQLELSAEPAKTPRDLVIWPEAAVTLWLGEAPKIQKLITEAVGPNAQAIIGIRRFEGARIYNSMAVLGQDGRAREVYDKTHLVPFGEYVPFGGILSKFGIYGLAAEDGAGFSAGKSAGFLDLGKLGQVLPLICYESIFPNMVHSVGQRPDWILQITNDAWFGKIAGPQQHLAQARVRAIEQGLPFIRVANTGISAVIDPNGRILAQLPMGVAGRLDADLPGHFAPTFYSRTGDWWFLVVLVIAGGLLGGVLRACRRKIF